MRQRPIWLSVVIAAVVMLGACSSGSSGGKGATAASTPLLEGRPIAGGSATFLHYQELPSLDSAKVTFGIAASLPLTAIYDTLVEVKPDGTIVPRLAESVRSSDGTVWMLRLRSGLKFSDGTPLDASAVAAHWDRLANAATGSPSFADTSQILTKEIIDPLTIRVTLKAPNGQWPRLLMRAMGSIPSPTAVAKEGADFATNPVTAGPFMVKEWVRNDHLSLVRNPNYWDTPKPYLDQLTIRPIIDEQQRFDTMVSGAGDFAFYPTWTPPLLQAIDAHLAIVRASTVGGRGWFFNSGRPPFDDAQVREAFLLAADVNAMNDNLTNGRAELVQGLFPKGSPFYDPAVTRPAPNLAKAQQLIDAYTASHGPIKVSVVDLPQERPQVEALQQQLQRLHGVSVTLSIVDANQSVRLQATRNFDLVDSSVFGGDPEPAFYDRLQTSGGFNPWHFSNGRVDADLERGRVALTLKDRTAAYDDLQKVFWDQAPVVLYDTLPYATAVGKRVHGFRVVDAGQPDFSGVWVAH